MEINGLTAECERKNVKCLRLYIKPPDGRIFISIPQRMKEEEVYSFVAQKREWIESKLSKYCGDSSAPDLEDGSTVLLWGEAKRLVVLTDSAANGVRLEGDTIVMKLRTGAGERARTELLDAFMKRQLLAALPPLIARWEARVGVKANEWHVRRMTTRWGSCNTTKGRIWLNDRLAMLPQEYLEYVIAHELCHLLEPSHNARFWSLVDGCCPGWKGIRKDLQERNTILR